MEIKWNNLIALALLIFALVLTIKNLPEIVAFLSTMNDIGPGNGYRREDRVMGLMCLGLIVITIVAIVKILTTNPDR